MDYASVIVIHRSEIDDGVGPSKAKVLEGVCMPLSDAAQPARVTAAVCMHMPLAHVPIHMCVTTHDITRHSHHAEHSRDGAARELTASQTSRVQGELRER